MKTNTLLSILAMGLALAVAPAVSALDSQQVTAIKRSLAGVSVVELPAKAAKVIADANPKDQKFVAAAVIHFAVELNASAVPAIVGAISHDNPALAPEVAVAAAKLQRKQLAVIVRAAAAGAPSQAGKIVAAMIKEFPGSYGDIAVAAAEGAPAKGKEILLVVADFVPSLQASIQKAVTAFGDAEGDISVSAVLNQSASDSRLAKIPAFDVPVPADPNPKGGQPQPIKGNISALTVPTAHPIGSGDHYGRP